MALGIVRDSNRIEQYNDDFARNMRSLSFHNELRRINGFEVSTPVKTYFFKDEPFWWASRLYGRTPGVPTQSNNLFGYGSPGGSDDLTAVVEVNLPWRRLGNTKGAFVEDDQTKSVMLARRDGVTVHLHQRLSFLHMVSPQNLIRPPGITLIRVCSVTSPNLADIREFVNTVHQAKTT
jgi:hypothetical protein